MIGFRYTWTSLPLSTSCICTVILRDVKGGY
jgi:hypothetical protein